MMQNKFCLCLISAACFMLAISPLLAQDEASDLIGRTNNLRSSMGLAPYNYNGALAAAAQSQAQWIVDNGNVSHVRTDGSGPRSRALGSGYPTADVAENIYGGTMASPDVAWTFWVNSAIHYAGLTNARYSEIGAGAAHGPWGNAYVLVFGNPGGPPPIQPNASGNGDGGGNAVAAVPEQPSYVVGLDNFGNIMHQIQPGDTLGDIALIYGYTWDDIPYMKQINNLTDNRELEVGSVFLVPPQDGTYTPTPGDENTDESSEPTETPEPSSTPTPEPSTTPFIVATSADIPDWLKPTATATLDTVATAKDSAATKVALVSGEPTLIPAAFSGGTITRSGQSPWVMIAVAVQVLVLVAAGIEFVRRSRRK